MTQMKLVRPKSDSERHTRSTVDTMELTPKTVAGWKTPPFQRELKINAKVEAVARQIAEDKGVLPGILTLGVLEGDIYIVDGQHRIQAFLLSASEYGYADVRTVFFANMAEMAQEFQDLNSQLVKMRPDDTLRALEHANPALAQLRKKCPYVGYDNIRRDAKNAPVLSMSTFIRAWVGSKSDTPTMGPPAKDVARMLDEHETHHAIAFLTMAYGAWGRDREYWRLWGGLNLLLCAWLYRRVVLGEGLDKFSRSVRLTSDQFRRGLMSLSAEPSYLEWLFGRNVNDRDRAPAYARIKSAISKRYRAEAGHKATFPSPPWAHT